MMKHQTHALLDRVVEDYPKLEICANSIKNAFILLRDCFQAGGKVLICGNGGSAADAEHIVGELMKGFLLKRKLKEGHIEKIKSTCPNDWEYLTEHLQMALPAISLVSHSSLLTAFANDVAADMIFAQSVYGYARDHDVLLGISTSGNAANVLNAVRVANAFGVKTLGLTGESGGAMKELCDLTIRVPATPTPKVQEYHLPVYHALCAMLEAEFFRE
ncbi:MAG: SIS domain-containing protein [bacterium]|nr:SIS domain-containing protein [bacterium]